MRRLERGGVQALAAASSALLVAVVVAAAFPGTSSAFTALITNTRDTAASKSVFVCSDTFAGDARRSRAYFEYGFREDASATTARDSSSAGDPGTYQGSHAVDGASPQACPADSGSPYVLDGSSSRVTSSVQYPPITQDFSIEVWFKTTQASMKVMGFESEQTGNSNHYDKQFYIDSNGALRYGIYDGSTRTIATPSAVNDGVWHQAIATTSSADGSVLYLDGDRVASDAGGTVAENFAGYWRIGEGHTEQWPAAPAYSWFAGSLTFAAAYPFVLTAAEVRSDWSIGRPGAVAVQPTASASASAVPDQSATATPAASASPADSATASPGSSSGASPAASASTTPVRGGTATAQPVPAQPDVSTVSNGQ